MLFTVQCEKTVVSFFKFQPIEKRKIRKLYSERIVY